MTRMIHRVGLVRGGLLRVKATHAVGPKLSKLFIRSFRAQDQVHQQVAAGHSRRCHPRTGYSKPASHNRVSMQDGLNLARPRRHTRRLRGGARATEHPQTSGPTMCEPRIFFFWYAAHIPWNIFRQELTCRLPWTPQIPTHTARRLLLSESSRPVITAARNG